MTLPSIPLDVLFEDWIKIYIMLLLTVVIVAFWASYSNHPQRVESA